MPIPEHLVRPLLRWFARHARDLPWRRTTDPYAIWISEIMLQQTQVKTVVPYWERWMTHLPNVQALAKARPERVLKLWEGLGYYSRARNLHRAAQRILSEHGGVFPAEFAQMLALPGIGRYTAGAICSIAFNQPAPVLDGNVIRVLTRVFGIKEDPRAQRTNHRLWSIAQQLVTRAAKIRPATGQDCSALNQALMELGATICAPRQPNCLLCPLRNRCVACQTGRTENFPKRSPRIKTEKRRMFAFVIVHNGRALVRQRPPNAINARLWEFPNIEANRGRLNPKKSAEAALGFSIKSLQRLGAIQHTITRHRISLEVFYGEIGRVAAKTSPRGQLPNSPSPGIHTAPFRSPLGTGRIVPGAKTNLEPSASSERGDRFSFSVSERVRERRKHMKKVIRDGVLVAAARPRWCPLEALDQLAFTGAHRKIVLILNSRFHA